MRASTFAFISPAVILMILFLVGPILSVFVLSFTDWQLGDLEINFIGLQNYKNMLSDQGFMMSVKNTLIYVTIVVPVSVLGGLFVALMVEARDSGKAFYRTVFSFLLWQP